MPQTVAFGSSFNPANQFVPDVYLQVVPPTSFFGGVPTSVGALVGTASWGPLNTPLAIGSPADTVRLLGGITAAAINDPHDLATDCTLALSQTLGTAGLLLEAVRVSDGTDTPATLVLKDQSVSPQTIGTLTAVNTGEKGNECAVDVTAVAGTGTVNVTVVPFPGGGSVELFAGLPNNGTLFGPALQNALNNGLSPSRGPSRFFRMSGAATTTLGPAVGTFSPTGGTDGRSVSTAQLLGSPAGGTSGSPETVTIGGSHTTNDVINIGFVNTTLPGGFHNFQYTVLSGDTSNTLIATHIASAINADSTLTTAGFHATSSGAVVSITWPGGIGAVGFTTSVNGTNTATVGGTATPGDVTTITVHDAGLPGGAASGIYVVQGGDTTTSIATGLAAALNAITGLNALGITASSAAAVVTIVSTSIHTTTYSKSVSAGGTETITLAGGPTETSSLGGGPTQTGQPSGIYALASAPFKPSVLWIAGLTDPTALPSIQAFGDLYNIFCLWAFASGLDTPAAIAQLQATGVADYQVGALKDWFYWFDTVNNQVRLVAPSGACGGAIASLAAWNSPLDQPVLGILGTERNNPYTGNVPYGDAELSLLGQAGIMVITNPTPAGNSFAFRNGYNTVGNNAASAYVEYSRLTNMLVGTVGQNLRQFLGQNQGTSSADPLRANVRSVLNTYFGALKTSNYIDNFVVLCNITNNPASSVAGHVLVIQIEVRYMSSVQVIFAQIQGGTTVQVSANQPGQSLAQAA